MFSEPSQAQAFAITLALHRQGVFSWRDWAEALAAEIAAAQAAGDADLGDTYYAALAVRARAPAGGQGTEFGGRAGTAPPRLGPRRRTHAARPTDRVARRRLPRRLNHAPGTPPTRGKASRSTNPACGATMAGPRGSSRTTTTKAGPSR